MTFVNFGNWRSSRACFLLIRQGKPQSGVCRTAKSAERSAADAKRRRSSAKSWKMPAGGSAMPNPFDVTDLLRDGF